MIIDLSGTTAIVTGSTGGIGFAIAKGLAEAGSTVVVCGREQGRVDATLAALSTTRAGVQARGVVADLASAAGCRTLIGAEPQADILVNNLGIYGLKDFFEVSDEDWEEILQTNVMSSIRLSRHYAQGMRNRGWGRIQFISSESAANIPVDMVHYGLSKAALQGLSRGLAKVLAGSGVTVNSILPGPTRTESVTAFIAQMAAKRGITPTEMETLFLREGRPSSLIRRFASPEEVANLCVYAASRQASATTGAALRVEGGIIESIV
jgi:NAD(P)-dependent dehydrogenase (short-subunit alcohol dehydrogenase family)